MEPINIRKKELNHELRNNITAILAVSNILEKEFPEAPNMKEYVEILQRKSGKILEISEEIFRKK
jgi:signal transduction histidine kinase